MRVIAKLHKGELSFYEVTRRGNLEIPVTHDISAGYDQLVFWRNGRCYRRLCHRVVAKQFVPNPLPRLFKIVDHIDRNPLNNHPSNLRWCNSRLNSINNSCLNVRFMKRKKRWESFLTNSASTRVEKTLHTTFNEALLASRAKKAAKYSRVEAELIAQNKDKWKRSKLTRKSAQSSRTSSSRRSYFLPT